MPKESFSILFFITVFLVFNQSIGQLPLSAPKCGSFQATPVSEITDIDGIGWKYANDTSKAYLNNSLFSGYTNKVCSNNGFLFSIEKYENGELVLEANYHYANYGIPKMSEIKRYSNRVLNGKIQTYYNSGQLCSEENYFNGKLNGEWFLYDEQGALITTKKYKDDIQISCKGKYCY
jgi:antitoxin component YwqK of YwqJK toxin-antitoxin module